MVLYSIMPLHLRWDLYPVPHEEPDRARHRGSYFELPEWWTHAPHFNRTGGLRTMLLDILETAPWRQTPPRAIRNAMQCAGRK